MTRGIIGGGRAWLAFGAVLLLFAVAAVIFGQAQNVWVDETTQLSGMKLAPDVLIAWLMGNLALPFGVPADRMPPISYLLDNLGWNIWGVNVLAFRLYHAAIAGAGLLALMIAMARRFSLTAALMAGLFLALSPRFVDMAVEIRAYPVFMGISCAQVALLIGGGIAEKPRRLLLFLLLGLLSAYTHFFGIVATSAFFLAVLIDAPTVRSAVRAVLGYLALLVSWIGLVPFVMGATKITNSAAAPLAPAPDEIVTFLFQLIGSSAQMVHLPVALLYFAGIALLGLLGIAALPAQIARKGIALRHEPAIGLIVALIAGLTVCLLASYVLAGFNTLSYKYNLWTLPVLAVLLALIGDGFLAPDNRFARAGRALGLAMLTIGLVLSQAAFLTRPDLFIHGPSRTLEAMLERVSGKTALIHTAGSQWAWGYFPLYWRNREALPQWLLAEDGRSVVRLKRGGDPDGPPLPLSALAPYDTLVVTRIDLKNYEELRPFLDETPALPTDTDLAPAIAQAGWHGDEASIKPGYYSLTSQIYRKRDAQLTKGRTH